MKYFLILSLIFSCASKRTELSKNEIQGNIYYNKGTQNLINKKYTQAIIDLRKSNELRANNTNTLNNLGLSYLLKGYPLKSIKYFNQSIELDVKNIDAKVNLAGVYYKIGRFIKSKRLYEKIAKIIEYPRQFRTYYNLALIEKKYNRKKRMKKYLKLSLKENSNYCPSHYQMALIHLETGQLNLALKSSLRASAGVCYNNATPILLQARIYKILNNNKAAYIKYQSIVKRFPDSNYSQKAKTHMNKMLALMPELTTDHRDTNRKRILSKLTL